MSLLKRAQAIHLVSIDKEPFLAALSSSRSVVVRRSVRRSVGTVCEKVTFRVLNAPLPDVLPCPEILQWTLSVLLSLSVLGRTP